MEIKTITRTGGKVVKGVTENGGKELKATNGLRK
jgi:hypothetical protein